MNTIKQRWKDIRDQYRKDIQCANDKYDNDLKELREECNHENVLDSKNPYGIILTCEDCGIVMSRTEKSNQ